MRNIESEAGLVPTDDEQRARQAIESLIARLQRIAHLEVAAQHAIEAAEAALDQSLRTCPALDQGVPGGTLYGLRKLI